MAKKKRRLSEAEWLAETQLAQLAEAAKGLLGQRKSKLFVCACCRRNESAFTPEDHKLIDWGELQDDGLFDLEKIRENAIQWYELGKCATSTSAACVFVADVNDMVSLADRAADEAANRQVKSGLRGSLQNLDCPGIHAGFSRFNISFMLAK